MTDFRLVGYNDALNRLESLSPGDNYSSAVPVIFDDTLTVTGLLNGRDFTADGVKLDLVSVTGVTDLDTMRNKVTLITITTPVDLDTINARVNALDSSVVLKGLHDASTTLFPVSTKAGESWIISVDGVIDGIQFNVNDRVLALVDGALNSSYVDWHKLDYTDQVLSVGGQTGAVIITEAMISDLQSYLLATDLDTLSKLNAIVGESILTESVLATYIWDGIQFNPVADPTHSPGKIWYSSALGGGFRGYVEELDITANFMEEEWLTVRNDTGVTIADGTPVYITGYSGGLPQVAPLIANGERLVGLATHSIETATIGKVTRGGKLTGPDYTAFTAGDTLYVSPTVAGEVVNAIPIWPLTAIEIGTVMSATSPGSINIDLEHHGDQAIAVKSYNFSARTAASGEYFLGGFYEHADADSNLTQAATTQVYGDANLAHGGHAFIVFGAAATDGTNITLTASGVSIEDGVLTPGDSEVLYTGPVAGLTLNDYIETDHHWVGAVTFTLTSDGVNFSMDFNYGLCKYEDFNNTDMVVRHVECVGLADAADTGFDVEFIHHKPTGWLFAATGFHAINIPEESLSNDYGVYRQLYAGKNFSWKRSDISLFVASSLKEGVLLRVVTTANNCVAYMAGHIGGVISK